MKKTKTFSVVHVRKARVFLGIVAIALMTMIPACGKRPDFEMFETRISASLTDENGEVRNYSAHMKAYINNIEGTINLTFEEPIPSFTLNCPDCMEALMERASEVIGQAYPEYEGVRFDSQ